MSCWVYIVVMEISHNLLIIFSEINCNFWSILFILINLCSYLFAADFIYLNVVDLILYLRYDPPKKGEKRRRAVARLFFHKFITFIMVSVMHWLRILWIGRKLVLNWW